VGEPGAKIECAEHQRGTGGTGDCGGAAHRIGGDGICDTTGRGEAGEETRDGMAKGFGHRKPLPLEADTHSPQPKTVVSYCRTASIPMNENNQ
jgi:hypothetical protein